MLPEEKNDTENTRSKSQTTNIIQSTMATFLPIVHDRPGQFYCSRMSDLPLAVTLAHRDHCDIKDCLSLYDTLQRSGLSEGRARFVLMNGKACYDYYKYHMRRKRLQYEETCTTLVAEYDNKLLLLASLYLGLCNWETSNDGSQHHADTLVKDHGSLTASYSYVQLYAAAMSIFETLGGHTMLTCRFGTEDDLSNDYADPHTMVVRLVTLFAAYKYASFIRPTLLVRAMTMIVCDITHPRPQGHEKKKRYKPQTLRLKRRKPPNGSSHAEYDETIMLCHIIVSYIKHIRGYVQCSDDRMRLFLLKVANITRYSDAVNSMSGEGSDWTAVATTVVNSNNKNNTPQCRGSTYRCYRLLHDDPPTKVYDAVSPCQRSRYTIKRYPLYYTYRHSASSCESTSSSTDNIDQCVPRIAYILLREIAVMQYLAANDPDGVFSACCRLQEVQFDIDYVYMCMPPGAVPLEQFMRCDKLAVSIYATDHTRLLVLNLIGDMCQAIAYCHQHDVLHGDVKAGNFIVQTGTGHAQLIDFGLSEPHFSASSWHDTVKQTLEYRAPELLLDDHGYTLSVDVWALGCAIHQILTPGVSLLFYNAWLYHFHDDNNIDNGENHDPVELHQLHVVLSRLAESGLPEFASDITVLERLPGWAAYTRALLDAPPSMFDPLCFYGIYHLYHPLITHCLRVDPAKRSTAQDLCQLVARLRESLQSA